LRRDQRATGEFPGWSARTIGRNRYFSAILELADNAEQRSRGATRR
jgi:hypothetical protein